MGTSGNSDCQWASRSALKGFPEDALTISAGNLFQNGTARMVKANGDVKFQFVYTTTSKMDSLLLLASTSSNVLLGRGSEKAFDECLGVSNVFPYAAFVQIWLLNDTINVTFPFVRFMVSYA